MKQQTYKIAGAILAGGKNSRMEGKNKAFLQINGTTLIQRTIDLLDKIFDEIMIITNSINEYSAFNKRCTIIKDKVKDIGPLGGIYAALSETSKDAVFFVPCDMPFLHNDIMQMVISSFYETNCNAVVLRIGSLVEPVHAVYKTDLKDELFDFIKTSQNYSIKNFLKRINVHYLDLEDDQFHRKIFKNINTIKDWERWC